MRRASLAVLSLFLLAACADEPAGPGADLQETEGSPTAGESISGWVRGPSGLDLCSVYPGGTQIRVSIYDVGVNPAVLAGGQDIACPSDTYSIAVPAGRYIAVVRAFGPGNGLEPTLPKVYVDTAAVTVPLGGTRTNNITVVRGQQVTGDATQDGGPFAGDILTLRVNAGGSSVYLTTLTTAGDGSWQLYDEPVYFQRGIEVQYQCGIPLGRRVDGPNEGVFRFAQTRRAIDCEYASGSVAGSVWTHRATALWTTVWPGFFDTHSIIAEWNAGWGVQFPVGSGGGSGLYEDSHLYHGGLTLATSNEIISGANLSGYGFGCGAECFYDFGGMAVDVEVELDGTRRVNFEYTTNGATPGVNLWIRQSSWDGPQNFTLLRYAIRNDGTEPITFNPGLFMDWDLGGYSANSVVTERQGRLMRVTAADAPHIGTLIIGRSAAGNYVRLNGSGAFSLQQQIDAMTGAIKAESGGPGDIHYFHSATPVTLQPGRVTILWMAIVAGETLTGLRQSANAAEDYVEQIEAMMVPGRPEDFTGERPAGEPVAVRPSPLGAWTKASYSF